MVYIFLNMRVIDIYAPHIHRYIFTLKKWRQRPGKNTLYGIDNTEISETVLKYQISDFP